MGWAFLHHSGKRLSNSALTTRLSVCTEVESQWWGTLRVFSLLQPALCRVTHMHACSLLRFSRILSFSNLGWKLNFLVYTLHFFSFLVNLLFTPVDATTSGSWNVNNCPQLSPIVSNKCLVDSTVCREQTPSLGEMTTLRMELCEWRGFALWIKSCHFSDFGKLAGEKDKRKIYLERHKS